jgi:hypothetical protein
MESAMNATHEGLRPVNCMMPAGLLRDLDAVARERQLSRTGLLRLLAVNEIARLRGQRESAGYQDDRG